MTQESKPNVTLVFSFKNCGILELHMAECKKLDRKFPVDKQIFLQFSVLEKIQVQDPDKERHPGKHTSSFQLKALEYHILLEGTKRKWRRKKIL